MIGGNEHHKNVPDFYKYFTSRRRNALVHQPFVSTNPPYILRLTTNLIKRYIFSFRSVYNFQSYCTQYYYLRVLRRLSAYFRHS